MTILHPLPEKKKIKPLYSTKEKVAYATSEVKNKIEKSLPFSHWISDNYQVKKELNVKTKHFQESHELLQRVYYAGAEGVTPELLALSLGLPGVRALSHVKRGLNAVLRESPFRATRVLKISEFLGSKRWLASKDTEGAIKWLSQKLVSVES